MNKKSESTLKKVRFTFFMRFILCDIIFLLSTKEELNINCDVLKFKRKYYNKRSFRLYSF